MKKKVSFCKCDEVVFKASKLHKQLVSGRKRNGNIMTEFQETGFKLAFSPTQNSYNFTWLAGKYLFVFVVTTAEIRVSFEIERQIVFKSV